MPASRHRFGDFVLDPGNRTLLRGGVPLALNARYFDALSLLVREHDRLVGKQRFFDEVWAGSVVTDAALTQAIKEIRRLLGDDASDPRFVRTVAGYGYCFIAPVQEDGEEDASPAVAVPPAAAVRVESGLARLFADVAASGVGGAMAGLLGGLLYGSALAFSPQARGLGSLSVMLVLLAISVLVGLAAALGVGLGIAGGRSIGHGAGWTLAGGAVGGFVVGGLVKLLGSDAFTLLVGHAPSGTTGGVEGVVIGIAVAAGLLIGGGPDAPHVARPAVFAALTTGIAGALVSLAGGSLMANSLTRVATTFDGSRLDMEPLGRLFGEPLFGPMTQAVLGSVEGAVFGGCVVAGLVVRRWLARTGWRG